MKLLVDRFNPVALRVSSEDRFEPYLYLCLRKTYSSQQTSILCAQSVYSFFLRACLHLPGLYEQGVFARWY